MKIVSHNRDLIDNENRLPSSYVGRFIYKVFRIAYASFIFYFLPYLALYIPQMAAITA